MIVLRRLYGFTLVELLIVITIIVVLIALLVPALERSMGIALRAVCGARSRTMMSVVHQYGLDNRSNVPAHPVAAGNWLWDVNGDTVRALYGYAYGSAPGAALPTGSSSTPASVRSYEDGGLYRRDLFHCPSNPAAAYNEDWLGGERERQTGGTNDWGDPELRSGTGFVVLTYNWTMFRSLGGEFRGMLRNNQNYWNGYAARSKLNSLPAGTRDTPFLMDAVTFDPGQSRWADRSYVGRNYGSSHMEGHVEGRLDVPAGGNFTFVDQSVHWKTFGELKTSMNWQFFNIQYFW